MTQDQIVQIKIKTAPSCIHFSQNFALFPDTIRVASKPKFMERAISLAALRNQRIAVAHAFEAHPADQLHTGAASAQAIAIEPTLPIRITLTMHFMAAAVFDLSC